MHQLKERKTTTPYRACVVVVEAVAATMGRRRRQKAALELDGAKLFMPIALDEGLEDEVAEARRIVPKRVVAKREGMHGEEKTKNGKR